MTEITPKTPGSLGYRMPAEWEAHAALWLAWPHDADTFAGCLREVEETYLQIIEALAGEEEIRLLVRDRALREEVERRLRGRGIPPGQVRLIEAGYGDVWIRDYGPTFVRNDRGETAMVDWSFNSWGGKYPELLEDTKIPARIGELFPMPRFVPGMVLEGGSIEVNGEGLLLTTEQCLLHPNRNPGLSREEIEHRLKSFLGVEGIIWLKGGIAGDDTDGHVDDVARFVAPGTVVAVVETDEGDENHGILQENLRRLKAATSPMGNPLRIIPLPTPGRVEQGGDRLPASYANFYIGNRTVLVPTFGHPCDAQALKIIGSVFPGRQAREIDCRNLVRGYGAIHCISLQEPARRVQENPSSFS
ncbi:MAG: agmatine deiminase family protein [Deltaproteobacteria bacterium]|nr:agmatine deiminase family protein [Deltaproteobacteria bacterium]